MRGRARRGIRIGYELMPFSVIETLDKTRRLVEGAAQKNGGVIFDLWHIVKLGIPYDEVMRFPAAYFMGLEINDGYLKTPAGMDMVTETTSHRKLLRPRRIRHRRFHVQAARLALPGAGRYRGALPGAALLGRSEEDGHDGVQHHTGAISMSDSTGGAAGAPHPCASARSVRADVAHPPYGREAEHGFGGGRVTRGAVHLYIGQEAVAAGVCMQLKETDWTSPVRIVVTAISSARAAIPAP